MRTMALLYQENGLWMINGSKHRMETLEKVAQTDPSYIWWVWHKVGPSLSDEAFFAVEDIMDKYKIPFNSEK
jgi:hypothetical protein